MEKLNKILEETKQATKQEIYPRCYNELLTDLLDIKNNILNEKIKENTKEMEKLEMEKLTDYSYYYNQAIKTHKKLDEKLKAYPKWIIDYNIDPKGENVTSVFLEMQGLYGINLDSGKPLLLIEWLEDGYYIDDHQDDNNQLIHDYINYLKEYENIVDHELEHTSYNVEPIASLALSNTTGLLVYDIINYINDYIIVGTDLSNSKEYQIYYEEEDSYFLIGDRKFYLSEFIRTNL